MKIISERSNHEEWKCQRLNWYDKCYERYDEGYEKKRKIINGAYMFNDEKK